MLKKADFYMKKLKWKKRQKKKAKNIKNQNQQLKYRKKTINRNP